MVGPESGIWVPVPETQLVEQTSFTNNAMVFSFYLGQKRSGDGAEKFKRLELESEISVPVPRPWSQHVGRPTQIV